MSNDLVGKAAQKAGGPRARAASGVASERLRAQIIGGVAERLDEMLDAILRKLSVAIPSYASLEDPALTVEERARLTALVLLSLRAALGQPYDETLIDAVRRTARRRAVRRFPLWAMLRSRDIKVRIVWDFIAEELSRLEASDPVCAYGLTIELSSKLLDSSAQLRVEEVAAYLDTEREHTSTSEQSRRRFFDDVLSGTSDEPAELQQRAAHLGYRLGEQHAVAVLTIDGPGVDSSPVNAEVQNALRRLGEAVSFAIVGAGMPLVQTRNDCVIAVFPASREDGERSVSETIESALGPIGLPDGCHLLAGLGRIEPALTGISVSYRQALRTLEGAHATGAHSGVIAYADMLPSLLLLEDPTLAKDSWRTTVEPLFAYDAENATQLVATLSVYLEERGVLAAAAKRLFVHRHTLAPRLEQIERLTGRSLQDRNDLFMLDLGLRARRFAQERALNGG
ncbi:MAG TPA: helix-turn-helix domain-containing protein [Solirubrobacteraceae bacterium]|jgi:sugar diacid utilization regulator